MFKLVIYSFYTVDIFYPIINYHDKLPTEHMFWHVIINGNELLYLRKECVCMCNVQHI